MKAVVILSGGLDSTTLLYKLLDEGVECLPLGIDYGQRHKKELWCAAALCESLGLKYEIADLKGITRLISNSSQTDMSQEVPLGHYSADSMAQTVVPARNTIMLSIALGYAINNKADVIAYGAHDGDRAQYADCRVEYADAYNDMIALADFHIVSLYRPFVEMSKADIAVLGGSLGVPIEKTWSCYQGKDIHCGACGTCVERREALYLAKVEDKTEYAITWEETCRVGELPY